MSFGFCDGTFVVAKLCDIYLESPYQCDQGDHCNTLKYLVIPGITCNTLKYQVIDRCQGIDQMSGNSQG